MVTFGHFLDPFLTTFSEPGKHRPRLRGAVKTAQDPHPGIHPESTQNRARDRKRAKYMAFSSFGTGKVLHLAWNGQKWVLFGLFEAKPAKSGCLCALVVKTTVEKGPLSDVFYAGHLARGELVGRIQEAVQLAQQPEGQLGRTKMRSSRTRLSRPGQAWLRQAQEGDEGGRWWQDAVRWFSAKSRGSRTDRHLPDSPGFRCLSKVKPGCGSLAREAQPASLTSAGTRNERSGWVA